MRKFHALPGLLLTAAIAAPWFIAITIREPALRFLFYRRTCAALFDASYSHDQPMYYVPIVIGGLVPWTFRAAIIPWRRLH